MNSRTETHKKAQELLDFISDNLPDSFIRIEVKFRAKNASFPDKFIGLGGFTMQCNED